MVILEDETTHITQTVYGRISSRHDASVRRQGQRDLRRGMGETYSSRGQSIKVRRLRAMGTVTAQMIRARGVEGNENDVGVTRTLRSRCLNSDWFARNAQKG